MTAYLTPTAAGPAAGAAPAVPEAATSALVRPRSRRTRPLVTAPEVSPAMYRAYRDIGGEQSLEGFTAAVTLMYQHMSGAYIDGIGDRAQAWQAFVDSLTTTHSTARATATEAGRVLTAAGRDLARPALNATAPAPPETRQP